MKKLLLFSFLSFSYSSNFALAFSKSADSSFGFIENKGQIIDQNNRPNKEILYLYNGNNFHVQLKQNSFSYEVIKAKKNVKTDQGKIDNTQLPAAKFEDNEEVTFYIHRIDLTFIGANSKAKIIPLEPSSDYINYNTSSTPERGICRVYHYQKIIFKDIYPNIDVEFILTSNLQTKECKTGLNNGKVNTLKTGQVESRFKYNFIIHPGGNINDIKLELSGANKTSLTPDGHILIETAYGNLEERIPESYQLDQKNRKIPVDAYFTAFDKNIFAIHASNYNPANVLIIDPVPWITYFGGSASDWGYKVETDVSGNVLVSGSTSSLTVIATTGAYQTTLSGSSDMFILKMNNSGSRLWSTYFGGTSSDFGRGIAADASGNIYITGNTSSTTGIATTGANQTTYGGGIYDAILAKFNSSGAIQWSTYFGASLREDGIGLALDGSGNVFITGHTLSSSGIASTGVYQTVFGGSTDSYIAKFTTSGVPVWTSYFGGNNTDYGYNIAIDGTGDPVIVGYSSSTTGIASSGSHQSTIGGSSDGFIAKFNTSGGLYWSTYFGGSQSDGAYALAIDDSANILISGSTSSLTGIATVGAFQVVKAANSDAFIAKFNSSGILLWGTYLGSTGNENINGMVSDGNGKTILVGETSSASGLATTNCFQPGYGGGNSDAFIAKFTLNGNREWVTYLGGLAADYAQDVALDGDGNICVTGFTYSANGISTPGAFQTVFGGGTSTDAFVAVITKDGGLYINNNNVSGSHTVCPGANPSILLGQHPTGSGSFQYLWICSFMDSMQGFFPAYGTNNDTSYFSTPLFNTTWFRRLVISGILIDTSNAVTIYMLPKPTVDFTINNSSQCLIGNLFSFNDISFFNGGFCTRKWNLGAGLSDTSLLVNVNKTYSAIGTYNVKLFILASNGCRDSLIKVVSVGNKPNPGFTINNSFQCLKENQFYFSDTSIVASGNLSRIWNFGTGPSDISTSVNSNKKYFQEGTYNVKLISNSYGCIDSVTKSVIVNASPNSGFTVNNTSQCLNGNYFTFVDTSSISTGTITRIWNFGNGVSDTNSSINAYKTYSLGGIYSVKLLVTGSNGCKDSLSKTVIVNETPGIGFSINNASQCINGNSFNITDTSTIVNGTYSRMWNFGRGTTDTGTSNFYNNTYTSTGTYLIKLILNNNGCKDSLTKIISVNPKPNAGFTINNSIQCLNENYFVFNDSSTINGGSLITKWHFGDDSITSGILVNKTYNNPGIYNVKLVINSNFDCKDSITKSIKVNPNPAIGVVASDTVICVGKSVTLSGTGALVYTWSGGILNGVAFTPDITNNYTVTGTDINACINTTTKTINVRNLPVIGIIASETKVCAGTAVILEGTGAKNYSWSGGVTNGVSFVPTSTSSFTVIGTDTNQCTNSATGIITVNPLPIVTATATQNLICAGNWVTLTGSGAVSYTWSGGILNGVSFIPAMTKTYTVIGTDSNNCSDTAVYTITVIPLPVTETYLNGHTITSNQNGATYQWLDCNKGYSQIEGATNQSYTATINGDYAVIIKLNNCIDTSACVKISSVGIYEKTNNNNLIVYPNPNNGKLIIKSTHEGMYSIVNELGQLIQVFELDNSNNYTLNLEIISDGIYYIIGHSNNHMVRQKIIVIK